MEPEAAAPMVVEVSEIVRRLAARFDVPSIGEMSTDVNGLAYLLGLDDEEAALMVDLGLFGDGLDAGNVLKFLEAHGEEWFRIRLGKLIADFQRQVRRKAFLAGLGVTVQQFHEHQVKVSQRISDAERGGVTQ